ncbi:MAG: histidine phosphatase family protein [Lentimicrobiaceae bacterium]|nr:histidine phosphatase family protein [Lentimicrobiaceae bacterium]
MKTLYMVRHAKSSWNSVAMNDYDRPLLEKGKKRTKLVIDQLIKQQTTIDLIIASPAVRALETAKILAHAFHYPLSEIRTEKSIYASDADDFFDIFFDIPARIQSVMLVGHNPTITNFANIFLEKPIDYLPTSGVVCIEFASDDWDNLAWAAFKCKFVLFPKMLE